ncbi:MAG: choice-of-anchor J domain-containing protein [Rufibacter sp.]
MIKNLLSVVLLLVLGAAHSIAQVRSCGTMEQVKRLERTQPNLRGQLRQQARSAAQLSVKDLVGNRPLAGVVTIPVVVHVVYNTPQQNISEAQIQSQITALNEDFRRQNANRVSTPTAFQSVAADTEIQFVLAQRTPEGEPTNGITRTQTSVEGFLVDDKMKSSATGGKNAWNTSQYLNIWVVNFDDLESVLGYAQFPNTGLPSTDGVVIDFQVFGTTGTAAFPFNLGRTTTHEVGHWLNLFHIWGDDLCGDDEVADTPTQEKENGGCPTFPHRSCSNAGDMFMNYMDYTDDACMNLFTAGQKTVMQAAITRYRSGLLTSPGSMPVQVPELDAALVNISSPGPVVCAANVSPVVELRNRGSQTLTSAQLTYKIENGTVQTFSWTGNLASYQSVQVTLPTISVTPGTHTLTVTITSRNNASTDAAVGNDAYSVGFQVFGMDLPLSQGFEGTTFPPAGWTVSNPDGGVTWDRTTKAAKAGTASAFMYNFEYEAAGQADELVLPPLNLTTRTAPKLTFQLAYALFSQAGYSDTLEVWISTNCGTSYQRVYQKAGRNLTTTGTPYYVEDEFVPTATQWRLETIDLAAYATAATALIKFRHITDFENNLYIDEVKVDGVPLGAAEELALQTLQISPNPTTGMVQITSPEASIQQIEVLDALGKVVQQETYGRRNKGQPLQLTMQNNPNGFYLLRLTTDKGVAVRRIMLVR